jgi:hypothetical protein
LVADRSNYSQHNFDTVLPCARQKNPNIQIVVTLGQDVQGVDPMWKDADANMDVVGPVFLDFLEQHNLDGYNFDWETNVDTEFYIGFLQKIRKALDVRKPGKYLITVAPGWYWYPWDERANGVVNTFDCMSYSNTDCVNDLETRVKRFEGWGIPKSTVMGAAECEPHWQGDPGWNPDDCIVAKTKYAVENGLQGMFSFRIDNDHGPWPTTPHEPTYEGHALMYDAAKQAGAPDSFVLNTYLSLYDEFPVEQIGCDIEKVI